MAFLNIVYQFGFDSAYLRLAHDTEPSLRKNLFSTAFFSQVFGSTLLSILLVLSAGPLGKLFLIPEAYANLLYFAAGILILDTLTVVPFAHLRLVHSAKQFAALRMANVIFNLLFNWVFVVAWHQGLIGIFKANLAASAGTLLLVLPLLFSNLKLTFNRIEFSQLFKFGLPLVPAGLYGLINEMAGRLFLRFLSQSDIDRLYPGKGYDILQLTGIFSAAWKLGIFGLLIVQMYRMAWMPFFLQRQKDGDAPELFGRILLLLCLFIGYASGTLMLFLDKLVAIPFRGQPLFHPAFWVGLEIVPGVLLAYAFQAWFIHFTLGIYIAKQTRFLMWSNGMGVLVTVAGNLLLIPRLGLWGATISAILCYVVIAILVMRKSQKLFPIHLYWSKMVPILIWMSAGWTLGILVQRYPEHFSWSIRGLCWLGFAILPLLMGSFAFKSTQAKA